MEKPTNKIYFQLEPYGKNHKKMFFNQYFYASLDNEPEFSLQSKKLNLLNSKYYNFRVRIYLTSTPTSRLSIFHFRS